MKIFDLIIYFFVYSFIGWLIESCYCSIRPKKWVNRGFLFGPMCPIYGTGAIILTILIVPLREITENLYLNEAITFVTGFIICDIVEYLTSYIMEKLFHERWWDYSDKKFNIHGRICLLHTIYWGTASCVFSYFINPVTENYFMKVIPAFYKRIIVYILLIIFFIDLFLTVIKTLGIIRKFTNAMHKLSDEITLFAKTKISDVETKVYNFSDETKTEFNKTIDEFKVKFENIKTEYKSKTSKSRERLYNLFPLLRENIIKRIDSLDELLEELKNSINKN